MIYLCHMRHFSGAFTEPNTPRVIILHATIDLCKVILYQKKDFKIRWDICGSESSREQEDQGVKEPRSELAKEQKGQGAKVPGSELGQGVISHFAPGSEMARQRKGSVPCRQVLNWWHYTTQHNSDHDLLCSNFYAQTYYSVFLPSSRIPVSGAWSMDSVWENQKLQYGFLYSRHFLLRLGRGVYPPQRPWMVRSPPRWPNAPPQFLIMMHLKCCADRWHDLPVLWHHFETKVLFLM